MYLLGTLEKEIAGPRKIQGAQMWGSGLVHCKKYDLWKIQV